MTGTSNRPRRIHWLVAACVVTLAGCGERHIRIETRIHPDGSIERVICQPRELTPADTLQEPGWKSVEVVKPLTAAEAGLPLGPRLPVEQPKEGTALLARGRFASLAELPAHYRHASIAGRPDGELKRELSRQDYGLLVVALWRETLNDEVSLDDQRAACQELADVGARYLPATLAAWLGEDLDMARVANWLEGDGARLLAEGALELSDAALRGKRKEDRYLFERLVSRAERYGLHWPHGKLPEELTADEAQQVRGELLDLLQRVIRTPTGEAISRERISRLVEMLGGGADRSLGPPFTDEQLGRERARFSERFQQQVVRLGEGQEDPSAALQQELKAILERILGLYRREVLRVPLEFHCRLEVPGQILQTNGTLTDPDGVEWRFDAEEAFPTSYRMECRWVTRTPAAERMPAAVREVLASPRKLARLARLAQDCEPLAEGLRECAAQHALKPLEAAISQAGVSNDRQQLEAALRLLRGE